MSSWHRSPPTPHPPSCHCSLRERERLRQAGPLIHSPPLLKLLSFSLRLRGLPRLCVPCSPPAPGSRCRASPREGSPACPHLAIGAFAKVWAILSQLSATHTGIHIHTHTPTDTCTHVHSQSHIHVALGERPPPPSPETLCPVPSQQRGRGMAVQGICLRSLRLCAFVRSGHGTDITGWGPEAADIHLPHFWRLEARDPGAHTAGFL